jgi:hypothetical protein
MACSNLPHNIMLTHMLGVSANVLCFLGEESTSAASAQHSITAPACELGFACVVWKGRTGMMPHGLCACYRWWKPLADAAVELVGDLADDVPEANDENASAAANTSHGAKSHASRKQAKLLSHEQPFIKAVLHAAALAKVGSLRPIN